jgi:peptide deformylase
MPYTIDGRHPPLDVQMPMAFVNTQLSVLPSDTLLAEEGCLSFPDIRGDVPRCASVQLTYQDLDGAHHEMEAGDWLARVLQHEYDHTQGVLFIDRMEARLVRRLDAKLKKLKRSARQRK